MGTVTVVRGQARRRWIVVAAVALGLAAIPAAVSAVPVHARPGDLTGFVAKMRASTGQPYQGYAESLGTAGLPALPQLSDVSDLLDGDTRMRVWYSSSRAWRVDVLGVGAERDTYHTTTGEVSWDYGRNQLTTIDDTAVPLRLPRGADLTPPELARRLLSLAGTDVRLAALPAQRIAGIDAPGVRLTPTSTQTTVARIDLWADPATGLPLRVEVTGRGGQRPFLTTRFLDVALTAPGPAVLTPPAQRPGVNVVAADQSDIISALRTIEGGALPDHLAGQLRTGTEMGELGGIATYGSGLARFLVISVPRGTGYDAERRAVRGGGVRLDFPAGDGVLIATPLLSVLAMDSHLVRRNYLLVGLVTRDLLKQAGAELSTYTGELDDPH
jgi:hypothetical protein